MTSRAALAMLPLFVWACGSSPAPSTAADAALDGSAGSDAASDASADAAPDDGVSDTAGDDAAATDSGQPDGSGLDACAPLAADCGGDAACGRPDLWACEAVDGGGRCAFSAATLVDGLLDGIDALDFAGGLPSRLVVHGADAFPIVADANGGVVVAGAFVGEGRVIVVSHEGPLNHSVDQGTGFAQLWRNASVWLANRLSGVVGVMPGYEGLGANLEAAGWAVEQVGLEDLAGIDILVMDSYADLASADLAALNDWVAAGGGLLIGGHAWWWAQSNTNAALNYPGNAIVGPAGITIVESTASDAPYAMPASRASELLQARVALDALSRERAGCASLSAAERATAGAGAGGAIDVLPMDSSFFDAAEVFSDAVGPVVPTTADPVSPTEDPIEALALRLQTRQALDAAPEDVRAHASSADFPGAVAATVPRLTRTFTVDGSYAGVREQFGYGAPDAAVWRSSGLYAAPGELITVTIPERAAARGLAVQIGIHTDLLWDLDAWERMPRMVRVTELDDATTTSASGFGGPVFITVPVGLALGDVEVTVEGAVAMPTYAPGRADWAEQRALAAPWVEIAGESFVVHAPALAAETLGSPGALMATWDEILDADATLAGIDPQRPRAERFVVDRQISAGWMHSGYPIMAHLESAPEVLDVDAMRSVGAWGPLHELGHNHQNLDWVLPGTTESSVNLWSVYASEEVLGIDRDAAHPAIAPSERSERVAAWLAGSDRDWSVWMALETYLQLQEAFGWSFYSDLFGRYLALGPSSRPGDDDERVQLFIRMASETAQRDLTAFFAAWGLEADAETATAVAGLDPWLDHPMAR